MRGGERVAIAAAVYADRESRASCDDCYFRRELLCALADGPCPTFRACGADVVELAVGVAHESAETIDAVVDLVDTRIAERQA